MGDKNILALDMSTKRTGYAISSTKDKEIKYGVIASSSTDVEKRICIMRDEIVKIIKDYSIQTIVVEDVRPDGGNARTGKVLTWLQGVIAVAAFEIDKKIDFVMIMPTSWRKILKIKQGRGVRREEQKQIDINFINTNYNLHLTPAQDDEADAIGILSAYLKDAGALLEEDLPRPVSAIGAEESAF